MNKTGNRLAIRLRAHFKNLILFFLICSLIVLVSIYIGGTRAYESAVLNDTPNDSFNRLWSALSDTEPQGLNSERLLPELIGYKREPSHDAYAVMANYTAISRLYDIVKPCILELFGEGSYCKKLTKAEGAAKFMTAQSSPEFVYIRYHTPVLYQVIYAFAADKISISDNETASGVDGNIGAYISEIIIVPDEMAISHCFIAYATDGSGNYYEFRGTNQEISSNFYISKLDDSTTAVETVNFAFSYDLCEDKAEPIVYGGIKYYNLSFTPFDTNNDMYKSSLLKLFEYNPDKVNSYPSGQDFVYVDSTSQLHLGNGIVSFSTYDSISGEKVVRGLQIGSLLGYTSSDNIGLFDKITAVDNVVSKFGEISPLFIGEKAEICFGNIYSENGALIIEYLMTFNSVLVSKEPFIRATITGDIISKFEVFPYVIEVPEELSLSLSAEYVLDKLSATGKLTNTKDIYGIRFMYEGNEAKWQVIFED